MRAAAERHPRWTLSRAGIINVYQYGALRGRPRINGHHLRLLTSST
jgi:hypothetical protein